MGIETWTSRCSPLTAKYLLLAIWVLKPLECCLISTHSIFVTRYMGIETEIDLKNLITQKLFVTRYMGIETTLANYPRTLENDLLLAIWVLKLGLLEEQGLLWNLLLAIWVLKQMIRNFPSLMREQICYSLYGY